jgi:hypothetical protein
MMADKAKEKAAGRAMPLLSQSRDGQALWIELAAMGIEPVEADEMQCWVVVE